MSRYTTVKVWQLTPEQIANYKPGMDLGEPHQIELVRCIDPEWADFDPLKKRKRKGIQLGRRITEDDYRRLREEGLLDSEIADRFNVGLDTLHRYKMLWRKERIAR
mgnify:FL=1